MKIVVVGIGQSMRGDDGVGPDVVRSWQAQYPDSASTVRVEIIELPGLSLLELVQNADVAILIDAIHSPGSEGMIIHLGLDELSGFTPDSTSAHGWGIAETLQLGLSIKYLDTVRLKLIGICGKQFDLGAGFSREAQQAIPKAIQALEQEVRTCQ